MYGERSPIWDSDARGVFFGLSLASQRRDLIRAIMEGRLNVAYDDIRAVVAPALRHRLILNFDAESSGVTADTVITEVVASLPE